jgi:hypothetical protein
MPRPASGSRPISPCAKSGGSSIRTIDVYLYENPPAVEHRCRVEIARLELVGPDSAATFFDGRSYQDEKLALAGQPEVRKVGTGDGLTLSVDGSGGVTAVELDGKRFDGAGTGFGGILLRDAATADLPKRRLEGLEFTPTYTARGGYLELSGVLTNHRGGDRFVTAYFVLPVSNSAWQWGESISAAEVPHPAPAFELVHAKYPLSALSLPGAAGLSLAVRMDEPVRYRLVYNPKLKLYFAAFDLALTPEKPEAAFRVILYRHDPTWGFRSALQRYYDFFPQFFEKKVSIDGGFFPGEGHDRVLMKKLAPVLRSLMSEGWEPVTGVRASTPDFRMERYGRYLVVHNKSNQVVRGRVVPELKSLPPRELSLEATETVVLDLNSPPP